MIRPQPVAFGGPNGSFTPQPPPLTSPGGPQGSFDPGYVTPLPNPGKGGLPRPQTAIPAPTQGRYAPLSPSGGFNVNRASAAALQQAMQGTQMGMGFQAPPVSAIGYSPAQQRSVGMQQGFGYGPAQQRSVGSQRGFGYDAAQQRAQQLASTDIAQYESPYQQAVIDRTLSDLAGAQEKQLNVMGAQAEAANAFGGSRQALEAAETRKGFAKQAADTVANLRQSGFQQAQQAAQFDVGQRAAAEAANTAARTAAAQYGAGSAQAAQAANIARTQQIEAANAAARTAAAQYGAGSAQAAQAANIARLQQMEASNVGARTAAAQYGATAAQQAQQQNFANQLAANQARMSAAQQMGSLGQQAFSTGQSIQQQQMQQGLLQQGLQQALIDAARGQFAGYAGAPNAALQAPLAALGVTPVPETRTTSKQPGLFDYLSLGATAYASDERLKTNINPLGKEAGINVYSWDWNDEGKRVADPAQPTVGVMAQELQATHPHLVTRANDGYLRVNYAGLVSELGAA